MAKLVIGAAPDTFKLPVEIETPSGKATIEFTAKHLLATEWTEMREANTETVNEKIKALLDAARAQAEADYAEAHKKPKKQKAEAQIDVSEEGAEAAKEAEILALVKPVKNSVIKRLVVESAARMIHSITTGWDLDDAFDVTTLEKMCDKYQNAHEAIFEAFNAKLEGRRLGNSGKP